MFVGSNDIRRTVALRPLFDHFNFMSQSLLRTAELLVFNTRAELEL
jgi:hypothetical protein